MGRVRIRNRFPETIIYKIFATNSNYHVKQRTTWTVEYLFFKSFLLILTNFSFWQGDWTLVYHSMKRRDFPDIF